MQDAAPVAAMQPGTGPASAPAGAESNGGFAQLLQAKQSSQGSDEKAASADLRSTSSGTATPVRQGGQQAAQQKPAAEEASDRQVAGQDGRPGQAGAAQPEGKGASAAVPNSDGEAIKLLADLPLQTLAAEAQASAENPATAKGTGNGAAKPKGEDGGRIWRDAKLATLAAAGEGAASAEAAQGSATKGAAKGGSGSAVAGKGGDKEEDASAEAKQPSQAAATQPTAAGAELMAAAVSQPAAAQQATPAVKQGQQEISLLEAVQAAVPPQTEQKGAPQAAPADGLTIPVAGGKGTAVSPQQLQQVASQAAQQQAAQQQAGNQQAAKQEMPVSAAPAKGAADGPTASGSQAAARGEEQSSKSTADGANKQAGASVQPGDTSAKASAAQQQPVQAQNGPAGWQVADPAQDGSQLPDKGVLSAYGQDIRSAGKGLAGAPAQQGAPDQAVVTPRKAIEDAFGTKAATVAEAKLTSAAASQAGNGSGDAGGKGESGQKSPGQTADQLLNPGLGLHNPQAPDAAQPDAKPATQSALRDSILSQVKDGVVTHDGKGSSEISIKLNPNDLGSLKIQISMDDSSKVRVEVQADNKMVKDLLMSNLDSLKEALSSKNFTMDGFQVSTGGGGGNSALFEHRGNPQQQPAFRSAGAARYAGPEEGKVNYMTADVNSLLDVRL